MTELKIRFYQDCFNFGRSPSIETFVCRVS